MSSLIRLTRPSPCVPSLGEEEAREFGSDKPRSRSVDSTRFLGRSASRGRSRSRNDPEGSSQIQSPLITLAVSKGSFNSKVDELIERFGAQAGHKPPPLPEDGELDREENVSSSSAGLENFESEVTAHFGVAESEATGVVDMTKSGDGDPGAGVLLAGASPDFFSFQWRLLIWALLW